ncbi:DinB family protein [Catenuloplanes japonicus]|uniref:DinB family protein n=1 Tax=Catenuloplanes japonicus TaxID=33876 RepID=UPI000527C347|nr:DinB family protein [Catenuloplanes japonicus]
MDAEKAALHEFLRHQRGVIRDVLAGLDAAQMGRAVALPSGWSPLWLVAHLGDAERHWFQTVFSGAAPKDRAPVRTPAEAWEFYDAQCRISDGIIEASALTDAPAGRHAVDWLAAQTTDLRRIILHVIEETARHAGHLDAVRELIDGRTGLGPR